MQEVFDQMACLKINLVRRELTSTTEKNSNKTFLRNDYNIKFHLYSLKVSAHVKIAMQCYEISRGGKCPKCPPWLRSWYESLEGLMDFLAFLVPKLWPKYCKLIREIPANPLGNSWNISNFLTITLAPETLESRSRAPKTRISLVQLVLFAVVWPAWKLLGVDDENVQQFPPQSYD